MGAECSVVTQPLDPLSNKHTTTTGVTGDGVHNPFLMARQCDLGSHKVRHEFLYLPDCPVSLMGSDLLCKLRAQVTFDSDGTAALKLRGPEAKTLILTAAQKEEWQFYAPELPLGFLSFPSRFQVYGLKITPHVWPEMCPQ
jgi:hypothetical protein